MMNNYSPSVYLLSIFAVGANIATVAAELIQAFSRLKGIIAGISSSATAFAPWPRNMPVNTMFRGTMTAVMASEPSTRPTISRLKLGYFL